MKSMYSFLIRTMNAYHVYDVKICVSIIRCFFSYVLTYKG